MSSAVKHNKTKKLLTIGEAANTLGVSIDTLRRWQKAGKITATRSHGGIRLFASAEMSRLLPEVSKQASYLTVTQAATFLGVSAATLRRWDRQGKLKPIRTLSNERMYSQDQLSAFAKRPALDLAQENNPVSFIKDRAQALSDSLFVTVFNRANLLRYRTQVMIAILLLFITGAIWQQHQLISGTTLPSQTLAATTNQAAGSLGQPIVVQVVPQANQQDSAALTHQQGSIELSGQQTLPVAQGVEPAPLRADLAQPLAGTIVPQLTQTTNLASLAGLTTGSATIVNGQTSVTITVLAMSSKSKVFVSQQEITPLAITKAVDRFTVRRANATDQSISFDWLVIN